MSRGFLLASGAAFGFGAIALATRSARASTTPAASPRPMGTGTTRPPGGAVELAAASRPATGSGSYDPEPPAALGRLSPLIRPRVSPHGAHRAVRRVGEGWCRPGTYPCVHWGVDLVPESHYRGPIVEAEFWVRAPEDLVVDFVARDDASPPLSGYGPGAVLARGRSGTWHVFGHLSPRSLGALKKGDAIRVGDFFGRLASAVRPPHVHWEPRRWRTEEPASRELGRKVTRGDIVIDPYLWLLESA